MVRFGLKMIKDENVQRQTLKDLQKSTIKDLFKKYKKVWPLKANIQ